MLFFVTHFLTNFGFSWPFFGTFFMQFGITFDRKTLYSPENWLRNVSKHKNIKKKKKKKIKVVALTKKIANKQAKWGRT